MTESNRKKVAIIGERDFDHYQTLVKVVKESKLDIYEVVIGDNKGVDILSERFAQENKISITQVKCDWKNLEADNACVKNGQYGPYNSRAALDKNQKIAELADCAIAVQSSGMDTDDMLRRFKKLGKPVFTSQNHSKDLYEF